MRVSTERLENCQVNVIIELDAAELDARLRETARKISRGFTVPGYRRGKAPFHAVLRTFGREAIQQQTLEDFGNEWYEQALKEIEYEPYQAGTLQDVQWDPFRMTVLLPIMPEVDLGDYRGVRVPLEPEPVSDEQIAGRLAELQRRHTQWVPVERPAALGDKVVVDLKGRVGDEVILDEEEREMLLEAGAADPLPGLHEQVVGMSPGEEKHLTLTIPGGGDKPQTLGREAFVTVRLHTVRRADVPPLDDELAMMVGDYDTLEALKAALREEMEAAAFQKAEAEYLDRIVEAMIKAAPKIEYPPQAVDREVELTLERIQENLKSSGLEMDRFLTMIGKTLDSYKQELRPSAEARLRKRLVVREIVRREGLSVEAQEVEAEIDRMVEAAGDQAEQIREALDTPQGHMMVTDDLLLARVRERLIQIARGEAPPLPEAESREEPAPEGQAEGGAEAEPAPAGVTAEPAQAEAL